MSRVSRVLIFVVLVEAAVATAFVVRRADRERPPLPNLERLDAVSSAEALELRSQVKNDDPASWQQLGDVYLTCGFFAEAEICYDQAAQLGPATHELLLRWGICLDRLGRLPAAISRYEQAAETAGDERRRSVCRYHLARCRLREERVDEALEVLLSAGDFELAQYELAKLSFRLGRVDASAAVLDRMLARYPDELKLNQLRQKVAEAVGDRAVAQHCRDMIERSQDRLFLDSTVEFIGQLRVAHGLPRRRAAAASLETAGSLEAAADSFQAVQQIEWDPTTAKRLVRLNFRLGRPDKAAAIVEQQRGRFGDSSEFLEQLGDAAYLQDRVRDAVSWWEQAVELRPNARLHQLLAEHYAQAGATETADAHRAGMEYRLGLDSFRENQLPEAIEHFHRAVELDPRHAESWYHLGEAQRQTGDLAGANASYDECLSLRPQHGRALDTLARLAAAEGR